MSNVYTKKEVEKLFENGLEFGYIGVYDGGGEERNRYDSRKMGIDYILEYIQEMLESKYYTKIKLYFGGNGQKHKLPSQKDIDTMYSVYECMGNSDFIL